MCKKQSNSEFDQMELPSICALTSIYATSWNFASLCRPLVYRIPLGMCLRTRQRLCSMPRPEYLEKTHFKSKAVCFRNPFLDTFCNNLFAKKQVGIFTGPIEITRLFFLPQKCETRDRFCLICLQDCELNADSHYFRPAALILHQVPKVLIQKTHCVAQI